MARGDLSNAEWAIVSPFLPSERGRWARPAKDNRRFLNGMLYVMRVGCPWRDMHERYGKLNSVYVGLRRWAEQGVWDALLETLVDWGSPTISRLNSPSSTNLSIDLINAPDHSCSSRILKLNGSGGLVLYAP